MAILEVDVVDVDDVRMAEHAEGPRFPTKAGADVLRRVEHHLERHATLEDRVATLVDQAHAAGAEDPLGDVARAQDSGARPRVAFVEVVEVTEVTEVTEVIGLIAGLVIRRDGLECAGELHEQTPARRAPLEVKLDPPACLVGQGTLDELAQLVVVRARIDAHRRRRP